MKNVQIVISNSQGDSFDQMLDFSKQIFDDKFSNNYIIIPDKFSLNAERRFFDVLNKKSTFNCDIVSFNRLAHKLLKLNDGSVISKKKGLLIVNKIIIQNKEKLQTFKKLAGRKGLTENIYETIMQFKSSGILPAEVGTTETNSHLEMKLSDIQFVYKEYENILSNGLIDEPNRLKLLENQIKISDTVKQSNFFISMFDSFTYIQLQVVKQLIANAKSVVISVSASTMQNNSSVYLNETLQQIISLCKDSGFTYDIVNKNLLKNKEVEQIKNNMFALKKSGTIKTDNVLIYQSDNFEDEFNFVAKNIKKMTLLNNYNYSDFNIACCGNEKEFTLIEKVLNEYDIPYYYNREDSFSNNELVKFVKSACKAVNANYSLNSLINFTKNIFVKSNQQTKNYFEIYCKAYGVEYSKFNKPFNLEDCSLQVEEFRKSVINKLNNFKNDISKPNISSCFSQSILELLKQFNITDTISQLVDNDDLSNYDKKNYIIVEDKLKEMLLQIDDVFAEEEITFDVYYEMLNNMFDNEKFSSIPMNVDAVFVGKSTGDYFYSEKVMFVVNAIDGCLPSYQNDCGIITDKEILKLSSYNTLNPSIKFINKREKNRVFNLLTCFTEKLFVSYSCFCDGKETKPSEVVNELLAMFNTKSYNKDSYKQIIECECGNELAQAIMIGNMKNAILGGFDNIDNNSQYDYNQNCFEAINFNKEYYVPLNEEQLNTSISKVEMYNKCPFEYYCNYVLKIKDNDEYGVSVLDIGTLLHYVAEKFVKMLINNNYIVDNQEIGKFVESLLNETLSQKQYKHLNKNSIQVINLKKESVNLCFAILYQINSGAFKPMKDGVEKKFVRFSLNNNINLTGVADRVDELDNRFNIIDYKTGNCSFSYGEIYTGKKLQLIVYAYVFERLLNKKMFGCFYQPVTNKFIDNKEDFYSKYKLSGIMFNSAEIAKLMDYKLESDLKSDIINVSLTKSGEVSKNSQKNMLDDNELENIKKYAIDMTIENCNEIVSGKFEPLPLGENACKYCKFASICGYEIEEKGYRDIPKGVTKQDFVKKEEDDEF